MKACRLRRKVSDAVKKVCTAHPQSLAKKSPTPDASKSVRRRTEAQRGHTKQDERPSRCLLMSFSLVAMGHAEGSWGVADLVEYPSELA